MAEFNDWNDSSSSKNKKIKLNSNPFESFDKKDYWAYADYKHMIELLKSDDNLLEENVNLKNQLNSYFKYNNKIKSVLIGHNLVSLIEMQLIQHFG